ncbi:MAG: hypothetical protein U1F36_01105 [Planctomycetota bacterium]
MRRVSTRILCLLSVLAAGCSEEVPVPVAFGSVACSSCRMQIDAPGYAVQCRAADGSLAVFDDPGCLVIEIETGRLQPTGVLFRHRSEDRWIPLARVGFVRDEGTPMRFGFAAVDRGAGTFSFDEVRAELRSRFGLMPLRSK